VLLDHRACFVDLHIDDDDDDDDDDDGDDDGDNMTRTIND
jgi:hypothetical protein